MALPETPLAGSPPKVRPVALPAAWARLRRSQRQHAALVIGLPLAGTVAALVLAGLNGVSLPAIGVLVIGHALSMTGICVGFHRLFTHPGFKAPEWMQGILCGLGSTAAQGPMIFWVATHRKHHRFSDRDGDPHSPHLGRSAWRRFWHAHMGWMFSGMPANPIQHAPDLLRSPALKRFSGQYRYWLLGGWLLPGLVLFAWNRTGYAFLEGVLWGGMVRTLVVQQSTWCVNSLCHLFGSAPHATRERSRNLAWLAYLTFGESWHNNHHAFPLAAFHGHAWWQLDPAGWVIRLLARAGWARELKQPALSPPAREAAHAA